MAEPVSEAGRYHYLLDEYYRAWFYHHPEHAVNLGIDGYADRLPLYGDDEVNALIRLHEKLIDAVASMDRTLLDEDQRIDVDLMYAQACLEREELLERDWRRCDPLRYLPVNGVYQLVEREVKDLAGALRARLSAIPGYLRGARAHLLIAPERIPALWLDGAIQEAEAGARYFRELQHHPRLQGFNLDSLLETAACALEEYAHFLSSELAAHAHGDFACGRRLFEHWLHYRHALELNAEQLRAFGQRLYEDVRQELVAVTRRLRGDDDMAALSEQIQAAYPVPGNLLDCYREQMLAARQFVHTHELVSLPEQESLAVVATPAFMRHRIPFAAYWDPQPTDLRQRGSYYVTAQDDMSAHDKPSLLEIQHTCVHEAWPGHHLQFVTANNRPRSRSVPRLINTSATLYEGWALYSEQLMSEEGFLQAPESHFILLKDRLWRALRIRLDVELQTGQLSLAQAAESLQAVLGCSAQQAMGELSWYSRSPTVPMGYATGWALINAAREQQQAAQQTTFSLRDFHDRLLASGSIALPLALQRGFGKPFWQAVYKKIFVS